MHLRVRAPALGALTLRLADSLVVQSIVSDEFGRLFGIRVKRPEHVRRQPAGAGGAATAS